MGSRIEIIGAPAYSWGRRTQSAEIQVPARRRGVVMGVMVTFIVVVIGAGAGLFLLVSDGGAFDDTLAFASPTASPGDVAPAPQTLSLPPLAPRAVDAAPVDDSAPARNVVQQAPAVTPDVARRPARHVRRSHRESASDDAFRRATRVGRARL